MVQPKTLVEGLAVMVQPAADDFAALAAAGYKTVINNRPDGEETGQLSAAAAAEIAAQHDLSYVHLPVSMQSLTPGQVQAFGDALNQQPGPIVAHCKSGTRSTLLWALSQVQGQQKSVDEVMEIAAAAGYDLSRMQPLIQQYRPR